MPIFDNGKPYDDAYVITADPISKRCTAWVRVDHWFRRPTYSSIGTFGTIEKAIKAVEVYDCGDDCDDDFV
ncbi:hypothetical protein KDA08_03675 [Candidatus Saccharibacteria bacterium]|nr:hypothetical protein [Candidatus Saccharibacteria bacterium]